MNITEEDMKFTRAVVWRFIRNNNIPAHVDKDDMVADGYLGLLDAKEKFDPDVIFNALHGRYGEDGYIQLILENEKIFNFL